MATLHKEIFIRIPASAAWDAIRDVSALHTRLVPGFVTDTKMDGETRVVTFGNGMTAREPILSVDDARRRLSWTTEGGQLSHYNAVMEVHEAEGGTRVTWTSDLLPHSAAEMIGGMQEMGLATMKRTLEGG